MEFKDLFELKYREIINGYLKSQNEQSLYQGQKLSRKLIEHNISPEDVISLHKSIMIENEATQEKLIDSFDVLLEVMIGYGLAYREHQSLRTEQLAIKNEIGLAANMQQTLLKTSIPQMDGVDIGALSVPARQMNGDYYHFVKDERNCIAIAIADVIGKGIPAALSMSMIKYAMDNMPNNRQSPSDILENLNREVEHNVEPGMFITMCYGVYDPSECTFRYANAGHEPGFFYDSENQQFQDLNGKGLLLGIDKQTTYNEYENILAPGDMVILFSDGVSECRTDEGFFEREDIIDVMKEYIHLPAQDIVTNVYKDLERIQDFELRDDFTLIILKRTE
ncbi:PP2C family protein-serine/threonine phosphatase [Bacillus sp. FSL K6-3431]|uniref:PP2C family protein-serine/threonine phosphatase n=1 Tax=Bacillus sp. FSL K6-3431 TaxID=2921500 RepID=UPI0030FBE23D